MLRKPLTYFIVCALTLLIAAAYYFIFLPDFDHPERRLTVQIKDRIHVELQKASTKAEDIIASPAKIWSTSDYPFYLLSKGKIVGWSSNFYEPEISWFFEGAKEKYIRSLRGDFVIKSWPTPTNETLLVVIPLIERFRITNRYLGTYHNPAIFPKLKTINIESDGADWFTVSFNDSEFSPGVFYMWCFSIALVAYVFGVYLFIRQLHIKQRFAIALWSLLGLLVVMRIAMIYGAFPAAWIQLPSFDSSAFASSAFNPTIFDLLLNSLIVLIFCGNLLYVYPHFQFFRRWQQQNETRKFLLASLCITIAFFGFLFPFLFFESIFHDSSITLDWTQSLFFDGPRIIAFLSVMAGSAASFMFCHVWLNFAFRFCGRAKPLRFIATIAGGAFFFALYYIPAGRDYLITLTVGSVYFLILYFTRWTKGLRRTSYVTFLYFIFALLCFGVQASMSNEWDPLESTCRHASLSIL